MGAAPILISMPLATPKALKIATLQKKMAPIALHT
jgi:hypothetical protein